MESDTVSTPAMAPRDREASGVQVRFIWVVAPAERVTPAASLSRYPSFTAPRL